MDWKINDVLFADADLENASLELANMASDRFTFSAPARSVSASPLFSYNQPVNVTRDGKPFFYGLCGQTPVSGSGASENHAYEVLGPWDQLERLVFMQQWMAGHWEGEKWVQALDYKSRCVLGQAADGSSIPLGRVIASIIDYAVTCGVPIARGRIVDGPFVPWDEVTDITCADAIRRLARWIPGGIAYFDYSQRIPVFNFISRSDLDVVSLSLPGQSAVVDPVVESVSLTPVGSRSVPSVVIIYEQSNDVNGSTMVVHQRDVFPSGATGREIGSMVQTISLAGWSSSTTVQKQTIHCRFIPDFNKDHSAFTAWLLLHHPEWASPFQKKSWNSFKFRDVEITSVTRTTAYPYELVEGTLQDWMRKYVLDGDGNKVFNSGRKYSYEDGEDVVLVTVSYKVLGDDSKIMREVKNEVIATKIHATNCPPGTYRNVSGSVTAGDSPSPGLAQAIWENLNARHYKGSVVLAEPEVSLRVHLGQRLLISGGNPEWTSMSAIVQSLTCHLDDGKTTIQIGPPAHLSASDIIELRRANRNRRNCPDASARLTGENTQNMVELGSAIPKGFGASSPGNWGISLDKVITDVRFDTSSNCLQVKYRSGVVVDYSEDEEDWTTVDGGQAEPCDESSSQ